MEDALPKSKFWSSTPKFLHRTVLNLHDSLWNLLLYTQLRHRDTEAKWETRMNARSRQQQQQQQPCIYQHPTTVTHTSGTQQTQWWLRRVYTARPSVCPAVYGALWQRFCWPEESTCAAVTRQCCFRPAVKLTSFYPIQIFKYCRWSSALCQATLTSTNIQLGIERVQACTR